MIKGKLCETNKIRLRIKIGVPSNISYEKNICSTLDRIVYFDRLRLIRRSTEHTSHPLPTTYGDKSQDITHICLAQRFNYLAEPTSHAGTN